MSIVPRFFFTLFKSGLRPIWERVSNLYLNFLDDNYIVSGTPSTLSSYVTHSRSGNATMTDSDGLIKWAPHNLLAVSEQFDSPAWSKQNTTITANSVTSPDGTLTADLLTSTGDGYVSQSVSLVSGNKYTFSVWLKTAASGSTGNRLKIYDVVGTFADETNINDDIVLTDQWALYTTTFTAGVTGNHYVGVGGNNTFSSGEAIYAWGAHLYRSDLGGMVDNPDRGDSYVPTTSSAVYLPRRNHYAYNGGQWVNEGLFIESESRQNLYAASNDFSSATYWNLANANIASSTEASPDGGTFSKFLSNTNGNEHVVYSSPSNFTQATGTYTESIFLKYDNWQYVFIGSNGTSGSNWAGIIFDLQNGVVTDEQSNGTFTLDGYSVEDWGNGVWRVSVTITSATDGHRGLRLRFSNSATPTYNVYGSIYFAGSATDSILIAIAQSEAASTPSSYIPTAGSTVTRAAETLTIPAANLPWPTAQVIGPELVTNGTFDTDTDWTKGTGWSISGGVASSDGSQTARSSLFQGCLEVGKLCQFSMTVSNYMSGNVRLRNGVGAGETYIGDKSANGTFTGVYLVGSGGGSVTLVVDADANFVGSIDNISVQEINPLSVSIQMDGTMTYADEGTDATVVWHSWAVNSNNRILNYVSTSGGTVGTPKFSQKSSGVEDFAIGSDVYAPGVNVPFNIASRHGSTFINGAVDGTALTADTTPVALPDLETTDLNLAYDFMGTIRTFRIWDEDLTDEGIAYVSERSEEPTVSLSFNKSESSFTVSDWLP